MGVNKNVFSSEAEKQKFSEKSRIWQEKYVIYHNLPFLSVFELDVDELIEISDTELYRLENSCVDQTLCDANDAPLVCVDFDGLQEGFNIGTEHHPILPYPRWNQEITELKLKVAHDSGFSYFVVGSDCLENLSPDVKLTIVDGIIGNALAYKVAREQIRQGFDPAQMGWSQEDFDSLPDEQAVKIADDWVLGIEVKSEYELNPISRKHAQVLSELLELRVLPQIEYFSKPDVDIFSSAEERIKALKKKTHLGAKVTLNTNSVNSIEVKVLIANFKTPHFTGGHSLAEEIATILAVDQYKRKPSTQ